MSAFFFSVPRDAASDKLGFDAYDAGMPVRYVRQGVCPLEFEALLLDSKAKSSLLAEKNMVNADVPERFFRRYYREDGSSFYAGTVHESKYTYPGY